MKAVAVHLFGDIDCVQDSTLSVDDGVVHQHAIPHHNRIYTPELLNILNLWTGNHLNTLTTDADKARRTKDKYQGQKSQ